MDIKAKIKDLYKEIHRENANNAKLVNIYNNILEIKRLHPELTDYRNSSYQDIKRFVSHYIDSVKHRDSGYDQINVTKILNKISIQTELQDKCSLAKFSFRTLQQNGYDSESKNMKKELNIFESDFLISQPYKFGKYLKIILHKSTYSSKTIILSILIAFFLSYIIFLPAPLKSIQVFEIEYDNYSDYFLINHFFNLLSYPLDLSSNFKVKPNGIIGLMLLIFIRLFYIIFILNFLLVKLNDLIHKN